MLNVTKFLCGIEQPMDHLRYGAGAGAPKSAAERRPVVVWNVTRTCNLDCIHCYSDSAARAYEGELTHAQGRALLEDLAQFDVPAVLFSGGEPLARPDLLELAAYARGLGLRVTLSTNGTLLNERKAQQIKALGFTYVGISLDGIGAVNDAFRGKPGAFKRAVRGIRNCKAVGQKVGLRLTLTPHNVRALDTIFDFIEAEHIERACFYHLVPAGRGRGQTALTHEESRRAVETIFRRTRRLAAKGDPREILTVDNHTDGAFLYMTLFAEDPPAAERAYSALAWNGGGRYSSGVGIADIDAQGFVHPDQFWQSAVLGNVKQRPFSEIWTDPRNELLAGLRDRLTRLRGRCATCRFLPLCGGNFRVRALAATGDVWAPDPACYLSDAEIA
ncbi:MAG: radical SAM protein [Candidatus Eremiobacteraeota bacterium]|nr:radical SAM protein [Candidatus Eremiobacteraeota bacterium]